ncbi:hypothetical protein ATL39_1809 [Sinobaca qinghaiensis]|uniref:SpoVT-AbrB domain-containing protein n=1 Tax=Sinobaca qinghaiensis TaxID=342944 RepID=A0A419V4V2_9BACL|nr:AbrB/MazE/SpoVT family DNA-binding domain-containing protein [Sinobaca qinghaiensis]RKD73513.1 hypothetical protein ATL39_1809 [Sinobaca qinghaiensis]
MEEKRKERKIKRIAVSSKRQMSIPKEFFEALDIEEEIMIENVDNKKLVITPYREPLEDVSEEILEQLIAEGFQGERLIEEFKYRKSSMHVTPNDKKTESEEEGPLMPELFPEET